jgi:hypothetical protein
MPRAPPFATGETALEDGADHAVAYLRSARTWRHHQRSPCARGSYLGQAEVGDELGDILRRGFVTLVVTLSRPVIIRACEHSDGRGARSRATRQHRRIEERLTQCKLANQNVALRDHERAYVTRTGTRCAVPPRGVYLRNVREAFGVPKHRESDKGCQRSARTGLRKPQQ